MSTFVRSSTSRSSLKHRLFTVPDENEIDDEEDDEEFEQFIKDNQIFDESNLISIKGNEFSVTEGMTCCLKFHRKALERKAVNIFNIFSALCLNCLNFFFHGLEIPRRLLQFEANKVCVF